MIVVIIIILFLYFLLVAFVLLLYLCFVVVSVPVYNVFVLCFMFLGSTLVQDVPFGATQSTLTNQINNNNNNTMLSLDGISAMFISI